MGWWATRSTPRAAWWCGGKAITSAATCTWPPAITTPPPRGSTPTSACSPAGPDFGEDVTNFFNLLTGICQFQGLRKLVAAPFELHDRLLQLVERESENARQGLPARIILKLNSLADRQIIEALYRASQAGVQIDLIVRGICCLRPGLKGVSENITVRSIVDRFLEHSRIYYFENACQPQVFISSADWMPRNFFRRIELAFPIEDGILRERLISEVLALSLADNVKARFLQPDGSYRRAALAKGGQAAPQPIRVHRAGPGQRGARRVRRRATPTTRG